MRAGRPDDFEEFVRRLRERDPTAQKQLIAWLLPAVRATVAAYLGHDSQPEELARDVLNDFLYDGVDRLRERRALVSYIKSSTVRRCLRLKKLAQRHDELSAESETDVESVDAGAAAGRTQMLARLHRCLHELSERRRSFLFLSFGREATLEEIGKRYQLSKQYVGQELKRSLGQLRKCMSHRG